jgi:hypothetical protein
MRSNLLLLNVLGENLVIVSSELLRFLETLNFSLLGELLSSKSLLCYESLNLGALVECLVSLFDLSANNILSDIVLFTEGKDFANVAGSLGPKSTSLGIGGNTFYITITLLNDLKSNDSQIRAADASAD